MSKFSLIVRSRGPNKIKSKVLPMLKLNYISEVSQFKIPKKKKKT